MRFIGPRGRGLPLAVLLASLPATLLACGVVRDGLGGGGMEPPPTIVLRLADRDVRLDAWTYCLGGGCADGAPPERPEAVGSPGDVRFTFAREGWDFEATFRQAGDCPRHITAPVEHRDGEYVVRPLGPAGTWHVDVFGRGPGGDLITTFAWTTTEPGHFPAEATGSASVLAEHDETLDSYGVELDLSDLVGRDPHATATITVTSADGRSTTLAPRLRRSCWDAGSMSFRASAEKGRAATRLGSGPFTYTVDLVLFGRHHRGTGVWPDDSHEEIAPAVPLVWSPPLPVYAG